MTPTEKTRGGRLKLVVPETACVLLEKRDVPQVELISKTGMIGDL